MSAQPTQTEASALRVGLVACSLNAEHVRGMGRYVFELVRQSQGLAPIDWTLYGEDPARPLRVPPGPNIKTQVFAVRGDRFHLWEQLGLPKRARADRVDVLHCTEGSLPWWQPVPTVVTVHDTLAWHEQASSWVEHQYFHRLQSLALHRCAAVITISECSRRDIVEKWPRLADKLTVVPHGIADDCFMEDAPSLPQALKATVGQARYVVYVGGPMERKRFSWALEVLSDFPDAGLHLVACGFGAAARDKALLELPPALRDRVHFAPYVQDDELRRMIRGAVAVLYPTLYEGFGFPVVEAHAAGVPCLFSAVGSLAELQGPLSFVVATHRREEWGQALARAMALSDAERGRLAQDARAWARQYSWRRSCEAHLDIYRTVAAAEARKG